jgi:hypothetical protein
VVCPPALPSISWRTEFNDYTFVESDRANLIYFDSESEITVTVPGNIPGPIMISGWYVDIKNSGVGANVNIVAGAGTLIGVAGGFVALVVLGIGQSIRLVSNGVHYLTYGF